MEPERLRWLESTDKWQGVWKVVRVWSRKTLEKASGRVLDVAADDDDDEDEDDDSG
jgi:hypothetical protein